MATTDFISNCILDQSDVSTFLSSLERYADTRSDKSFHYVANRVMKDVAARSAQFTHHASDSQLRKMLGQPAVQMVTSKKTGNLYRKRTGAKATNDAGAILAARMSRAGKNPRKMYSHGEWQTKVKFFVGRTLASINFMRAGWLPAFKRLQVLVQQGSGISQSSAFGRTKIDMRGQYAKHAYTSIGGAIPAQEEGDFIRVEIWNDAVNPRNPTSWSKGLGRWGVAGLEQALLFKSVDLNNYIEEVHNQRASRAGL